MAEALSAEPRTADAEGGGGGEPALQLERTLRTRRVLLHRSCGLLEEIASPQAQPEGGLGHTPPGSGEVPRAQPAAPAHSLLIMLANVCEEKAEAFAARAAQLQREEAARRRARSAGQRAAGAAGQRVREPAPRGRRGRGSGSRRKRGAADAAAPEGGGQPGGAADAATRMLSLVRSGFGSGGPGLGIGVDGAGADEENDLVLAWDEAADVIDCLSEAARSLLVCLQSWLRVRRAITGSRLAPADRGTEAASAPPGGSTGGTEGGAGRLEVVEGGIDAASEGLVRVAGRLGEALLAELRPILALRAVEDALSVRRESLGAGAAADDLPSLGSAATTAAVLAVVGEAAMQLAAARDGTAAAAPAGACTALARHANIRLYVERLCPGLAAPAVAQLPASTLSGVLFARGFRAACVLAEPTRLRLRAAAPAAEGGGTEAEACRHLALRCLDKAARLIAASPESAAPSAGGVAVLRKAAAAWNAAGSDALSGRPSLAMHPLPSQDEATVAAVRRAAETAMCGQPDGVVLRVLQPSGLPEDAEPRAGCLALYCFCRSAWLFASAGDGSNAARACLNVCRALRIVASALVLQTQPEPSEGGAALLWAGGPRAPGAGPGEAAAAAAGGAASPEDTRRRQEGESAPEDTDASALLDAAAQWHPLAVEAVGAGSDLSMGLFLQAYPESAAALLDAAEDSPTGMLRPAAAFAQDLPFPAPLEAALAGRRAGREAAAEPALTRGVLAAAAEASEAARCADAAAAGGLAELVLPWAGRSDPQVLSQCVDVLTGCLVNQAGLISQGLARALLLPRVAEWKEIHAGPPRPCAGPEEERIAATMRLTAQLQTPGIVSLAMGATAVATRVAERACSTVGGVAGPSHWQGMLFAVACARLQATAVQRSWTCLASLGVAATSRQCAWALDDRALLVSLIPAISRALTAASAFRDAVANWATASRRQLEPLAARAMDLDAALSAGEGAERPRLAATVEEEEAVRRTLAHAAKLVHGAHSAGAECSALLLDAAEAMVLSCICADAAFGDRIIGSLVGQAHRFATTNCGVLSDLLGAAVAAEATSKLAESMQAAIQGHSAAPHPQAEPEISTADAAATSSQRGLSKAARKRRGRRSKPAIAQTDTNPTQWVVAACHRAVDMIEACMDAESARGPVERAGKPHAQQRKLCAAVKAAATPEEALEALGRVKAPENEPSGRASARQRG